MQIIVLSEKQQQFKGLVYWKCGAYFQRYGKRLHVVVYEAFNGPVPPGYHVHHMDENKANNEPDNLHAKLGVCHMSGHHKGHARPLSKNALDAAKLWHASEEGRKWHEDHYRQTAEKLHATAEFICDECGKSYIAEITGSNRFCSNNCKTKWRKKSGIDNETRVCAACSREFVVNKYSKTKSCSPSCAFKVRKS